jgi:hypothetical protein
MLPIADVTWPRPEEPRLDKGTARDHVVGSCHVWVETNDSSDKQHV